MGNKPITFIRQVLAIVTHPPLLESSDFPEDAKARAREILKGCKGGSVGSYSESPGLEIIRRHVAEYIKQRDGGIESDWQKIMLCAGASEVRLLSILSPPHLNLITFSPQGIRACLKLLTGPGTGKRPGVMIPIPQYPLYSASLAEYNMDQVR